MYVGFYVTIQLQKKPPAAKGCALGSQVSEYDGPKARHIHYKKPLTGTCFYHRKVFAALFEKKSAGDTQAKDAPVGPAGSQAFA